MMDKVLCPWCGGLMTLNMNAYSDGTVTGAWYECLVCKAGSPYIEDDAADDIKAAALSAALRRYVELNRVLTLVEAKAQTDDPIWCEFRNEIAQNDWYVGYDLAILALHLYDYETFTEEAPTQEHSREMAEDDYGKTWRCWLRRPTDEERQSVAWET